MSRQSYQVFVQISEARDLIALDSNNMSDPFVVVRVGPSSALQRKTEAKMGTVSAVWESKFMFEDVQLTEEEFRREKLSISIYDRNDFFRNTLIGLHEFSLTNIQRQKGSQYDRKWFPVTIPENPGEICGYLLITTYVLKQGIDPPDDVDKNLGNDEHGMLLTTPSIAERSAYLLNILIYNGQHILEHSKLPFGGSRNPFVTVRFNSNVASTSHVSDTSAPTWNYRLSLPFNVPLTSESIELQLWNNVSGRPVQLISDVIFNYFNQGLAHKAWGPKWINFYSSDYENKHVSVLGGLKSSLDSGNSFKSEYVGRVMVRMSVVPVERYNHRIQIAPCNPVIPPPLVEYCLDLQLYQALEIPVLGGQIKVTVTFGDKRAESSKKLGKDGVFTWMETMQPVYGKFDKVPGADDPFRLSLRLFGPADLEQVHDLVISVYHVVGGSVRKIAFTRLKPINMLPQGRLDSYFVNGQYAVPKKGMMSERMLSQMWAPRWYTLSHTNPDDNPQVVAGMLLMSIGFGVTSTRPLVVPRPISRPKAKFMLRAYIYQGANLLAADTNNITSNPFLVIRFGEASYRTRTLQGTVFPMWYEFADLGPVTLDRENQPCLFLQQYHQTQLQNVLIGRTDILGQHVMQNSAGTLYRYQLYYEPVEGQDEVINNPHNVETSKPNPLEMEKRPYILACFQLIPFISHQQTRYRKYPVKKEWTKSEDWQTEATTTMADDDEENGRGARAEDMRDEDDDDDDIARVKLLRNGEDEDAASTKEFVPSYVKDPTEIYYRPQMLEYACKLELVGLRCLRNLNIDMEGSLAIELSVPNVESQAREWRKPIKEKERQWSYVRANSRIVDRTCVNQMTSVEWNSVLIPKENPNGVAIKIVIKAEGSVGDEVIGVQYVHQFQNELIRASQDQVIVPPFYQFRGYYESRMTGDNNATTKATVEEIKERLNEYSDEDGSESGDNAFSDDDNAIVGHKEKINKNYLADQGIDLQDLGGKQAATHANADGQTHAEQGVVHTIYDDDSDENSELQKSKKIKPRNVHQTDMYGNPVFGVFDDDSINVYTESTPNQVITQGYTQKPKHFITLDEDEDDTVATNNLGFLGGGEETVSKIPHSCTLHRGKQLGFSKSAQTLLQYGNDMYWKEVGVIRFYFHARVLPAQETALTLKHLSEDAREEVIMRQEARRQEVTQNVRDIDNLSWLQDRVFSERYVIRLAIYEGKYLAPRESFFTGNQTANPYVIVSNGPDDISTINNRENYRTNTLHPDFFQSFQLQTELPRNNQLNVQVWNRDDFSGDTQIGYINVDAEEQVIERKTRGLAAYYPVSSDYSKLTQGKLKMKVDVLTEDEGRRIQIEDLTTADPNDYEVRMVIWSTRSVKVPNRRNQDEDIDQILFVTTNFDGEYGEDSIKETDTAWYTSGDAEWNWRFVWNTRIPCLVPRVKISLWENNIISEMEAIAEINYNLQPLFNQMLRDKTPMLHKPQHWVAFTHPSFPTAELGEICLEFWIQEKQEANANKVGEAQKEPNENPYLPPPVRKPAPWQVGSRAVNFFSDRKKLIIFIIVAVVILIVIIIIIVVVYVFRKQNQDAANARARASQQSLEYQ